MADEKQEPVGIVVTGDENFGGKQGFVSAEQAAEAGIQVTGLTQTEPLVKEEEKPTAKKASTSKKK